MSTTSYDKLSKQEKRRLALIVSVFVIGCVLGGWAGYIAASWWGAVMLVIVYIVLVIVALLIIGRLWFEQDKR